jgi:ABC-type dipeptide/oligopeptide/nickel transport system permease subunit
MVKKDNKITQEKELLSKATLYADAWRRLKKNRLAMFGLLLVGLLILLAVFAPWIAPYDPTQVNLKESFLPPSPQHLCGTDLLGRDIFSRIIYGSRVSLAVGVVAIGISVILGLFLGAISGYFGGRLDSLVMRLADIFFAFPWVLGAIAIMTILGPGLVNVFIAIGVLGWATFARIFRGSILSVKESEYVQAARAVGASHARIIYRHIFPNAISPIIVYGTMSVGTAIIVEAALSFLGIGVQPPQPSWGYMLSEAMDYLAQAPWMMYFPGLAIVLTVLGFVLLADGLRDALDPRLKGLI